MKSNKKAASDSAAKKAKETLRKFIDLFEKKGWLDQTLRIKYRDRKYRIFCNRTGFIAYRINDYCGVSPGIPGWPVCFVSPDQILEDTDLSELASNEPGAQEWAQSIANNKLEII
ncbi:MAG: hypothetical protein C0407_04145 [Desulfobacca sp.]|nr:hypothetical protein [Desulfobacca sp.]